ncbi:MAG: hypothetical protein DRI65_11020 [Chloroflexota bacterium]|nr:MAG: hypothetical protein DRI65_11020 [Chloroflexota bacterium]
MGFRNAIIFLFSCLVASQATAAPFETDLLETDDLRLLYFDPFQTYLVPHVTRTFHNSLEFQKYIFEWEPYEKPTILLSDFTDYGNGAALVSPGNLVMIDIAPKSRTLETMPSSERFFMLMNHELVHIATMDVSNEQDRKWRRFFGGKVVQTDEHPETIIYNYLTTPRRSSPRWYAEGSATFMETWLSGGIGRAQGGYDEMVFRAMVRDNAHFYSNLGLVSEGTAIDFQVGANAYLYGTRFMTYLGLAYSPQHVVDWLKRGEDSERYYAKQFEQVFGKDLEEAWTDWITFENTFQNANLSKVRQQALTPSKPLVTQPMGSVSRAFIDVESKQLVGAFRIPGVVAHVGLLSLESGELEHLVDIKGPMLYRVTSPAWDPQSKTFFYTADNFAYRDLMAIDTRTGKSRMLIKDARIGDLVFDKSDRSLLGLRHMNGFVSLVRIPHPYTEWNQIYTWPQGRVAYELDASPDGELISVSVGEISGDQFLTVYRISDLKNGEERAIAQYDFGTAAPEGFVFSPDGKYLYGSSYITGVSNIFRYEISTGEIEAVSNAETGFFRPIPMQDGSLMVFEYTGHGFLPSTIDPVPLEDLSAINFLGAELAEKHPIVKEWSVVETLSDIDFEEKITHQGKYRPMRELGFGSGYPIIEGYRDSVALGYAVKFHDPVQFHSLDISASYSLDNTLDSNERFHFNAEYRALNWHARYWHNDADFYDLFGPTKRSRKGDAFMVGYDKALIFDEPRELDFSADVAYYTGLDTLPGNQNVPTLFFEDILHGQVELNYSNTRKSLGAVDHEKGWRWDVVVTADHANNDTIPKLRLGLDFGFALPWKHSSVWFYNSAGTANGERLNTLTNYYFGGFGNNYVDNREIKRYRKFYSMPGFEIDAISARDFAKSVVEWNLPPVRFKSVGTPGFFLSWVRPAVFVSTLWTDPGERFDRTFTSAGFQLDLHFTLSHRHAMTLSAGYAAGYKGSDKRDDEIMISLKIL